MLSWLYEKPILEVNASRGQPRASALHGPASPGSRCGNEDRSSLADTGGSASGMDRPGIGDDASEPESLDAQGERAGAQGPATGKAAGATSPLDTEGASTIGRPSGTVPLGVWAEPGSMGRTHLGGAPEAPLWNKLEGPAGPVLDAPAGLSAEAGWVFLSASQERRSSAISPGFKKNCDPWSRGRRSYSRMKRGLPSILAWGWDGPRWESGCGLPQPASTGSD